MNITGKVSNALEVKYENAEEAFEEYSETGLTKNRCLRCGRNFLFYDGGSGYEI
jgi:hypothetical protein